SAAIGAGLVDGLPASLAGRTGALDGEKALDRPHLAMPVAGLAGGGAGAGLRPRAAAGVALDGGGDVDIDRAAEKRIFQRDFKVVAQVRAARAGAGAALAASAHEISEDVLEDVGHRGGEIGSEAAAPAIEGRVAEPVIGG